MSTNQNVWGFLLGTEGVLVKAHKRVTCKNPNHLHNSPEQEVVKFEFHGKEFDLIQEDGKFSVRCDKKDEKAYLSHKEVVEYVLGKVE